MLCAKGIERGSDAFMSAVAAEVLRRAAPVAVLSGPSFAADVARNLPTAVTLAAADAALAAGSPRRLSGPALRLYHTDDVRGVEIGGAGKNVLAIASGIVAGRGLGESARAALIARAFAELMRFARELRRAARDADGPVGPRRPRAHRLLAAIAQLRLRRAPRPGRLARGGRRRQARRGRLHGGGAGRRSPAAQGVEMPVAEAVAAIVAGRRERRGRRSPRCWRAR